jgi:hypothetical protein
MGSFADFTGFNVFPLLCNVNGVIFRADYFVPVRENKSYQFVSGTLKHMKHRLLLNRLRLVIK